MDVIWWGRRNEAHTTRLNDRWGGRRWLFRAFRVLAFAGQYGRRHRLAVDRLFAHTGQRALDLGCGPGMNLPALADAVGPSGRVVGLDAREVMVRRARGEAVSVGESCSVVRGDASSLPFPDRSFDRAFSSLSVGAVPDAEASIEAVARVLRPGGRFVVFVAQPFETLPLAYLNPFGNPISAWATDRYPDRDVPALLGTWFDAVHVESFGDGAAFVATAELDE